MGVTFRRSSGSANAVRNPKGASSCANQLQERFTSGKNRVPILLASSLRSSICLVMQGMFRGPMNQKGEFGAR